jgi:hypothetical protein
MVRTLGGLLSLRLVHDVECGTEQSVQQRTCITVSSKKF